VDRAEIPSRRAWPVVGAAVLAAFAVEGGRVVIGRVDQRAGAAEAFRRSASDPYRRMEARLSEPLADRYRPASVRCQTPACSFLFTQADLARMEKARDLRGLATAFALDGERGRALEILRSLPRSLENENDIAALLLAEPRSWNEALERLDGVLREDPRRAQALFNRALLLARLDLPLAAARSYRAVAALGEPGWVDEASASAEQLETLLRARRARAEGRPPAPGEGPEMAALASVINLDNALAYQRLAGRSGQHRLRIRAWQLVARARIVMAENEMADSAFDQALALCDQRLEPEVCVETIRYRADYLLNRRRLQTARRWAMEAKAMAREHDLPAEEAWANLWLQNIEEMRQSAGLAAAFAEEASLQDVVCTVRQRAHEFLAKLATRRGDFAAAEGKILEVQSCAEGGARFQFVGLEVLAELLREPGRTRHDLSALFEQELARRRALPPRWGEAERVGLDMVEARGKVVREPERARAILAGVIRRIEALDSAVGAEAVRAQSHATLVMQAGRSNRFADALPIIERWQRLTLPDRCVVALIADSGRRLVLTRTATGAVLGTYHGGPARAEVDRAPIPGASVAALSTCPRVAVVATPPFLGQSRLLPDDLAWGFLVSGAQAVLPSRPRRLLVSNVEPPAELNLPRLSARLTASGRSDEEVEILEGQAASPRNVLEKAAQANEIELHTHGIVDPEVSDVASLVLSGVDRQQALLLTSDLTPGSLRGHPGVMLGACTASLPATYGAMTRSLPLAFMQAGAAWVMASPSPIEDAEAPLFFENVWQRVRAGAAPVTALRDERRHPRWGKPQSAWTRDVVAVY
jgi:hypothetical protein